MITAETIRRRVRAQLQEQRALVSELLARRELLQGSLFLRFGVCGKEGCVCRTGQRHGPYYVLSTRRAGHSGFAYLDPTQIARARELVRAYRAYRAGLRRLRRVNQQLVGLLRRYQEVTARRGGHRVGLPPQPAA